MTVEPDGGLRTTGSATEAALLVAAHAWGVDSAPLRERHPLQTMSPRGDGRNWMGSLHAGTRHLVAVKGAPEEVLRISARWALRRAARPSSTPGPAAES